MRLSGEERELHRAIACGRQLVVNFDVAIHGAEGREARQCRLSIVVVEEHVTADERDGVEAIDTISVT